MRYLRLRAPQSADVLVPQAWCRGVAVAGSWVCERGRAFCVDFLGNLFSYRASPQRSREGRCGENVAGMALSQTE